MDQHSKVGDGYRQNLTDSRRLIVPAARSEEAVNALCTAARSGKIGDGKIFVSDVAEAIRIRNGDRGDAAL